MPIPNDYLERTYAGVLGKIIGVYLGRPIEGWRYEQITEEIGEVDHYLVDENGATHGWRKGAPLVVTDDDVTGTFTFLRALADNGYSRDLTPQQIANGWLNYTIERKTIFWWGGLGNATEHTAYLRLKHGVPAPQSGSVELNGKVISEQIGSQIFIDGWAMVAPGDPEFAADLARRAASVSHDGEAIYGAQVVAAMESAAYVESDLNKLLDIAVGLIPKDSVIARVISDVREWHAKEPDWRKARELIAAKYGYDKFIGACHMVPNHALIIHSLLYGDDDFRKSLMIVNTSGWDTDCNSANVGCLLGIKNGLATMEGDYDWRGPVEDRLYLPTASGGRAVSDAVIETYHIVNAGRALAGQGPLAPKNGARFHFELPGSVQGFQAAPAGSAAIANTVGFSATGQRSLAIDLKPGTTLGPTLIWSPTFIPPEALNMPGYEFIASPALFSGQTVRARVSADPANAGPIEVGLVARYYGGDDKEQRIANATTTLAPGASAEIEWTIPSTGGCPIFGIGLECGEGASGRLFLDYLTWEGAPDTILTRPTGGGTMWQRAWVNGVDQFEGRWQEPFRIVKNEGTGLISQGGDDWTDYTAEAPVTVRLAESVGLAARVGGLRRYYALLLTESGSAQLVRVRDCSNVLAETPFAAVRDRSYLLRLEVRGSTISGSIDGKRLFSVTDDGVQALRSGGIGLVATNGCQSADWVRVADKLD